MRTLYDQHSDAIAAALLVDEAVALVSAHPAGLAIMARGGVDRTAAPRQDRLVAAIRALHHRQADALWQRANALWWRLAEEHRAIVVREASRIARRSTLSLEDLHSEGLIGAWEGCRRFDVSRGSLKIAIGWWVRAALRLAADRDRPITIPAGVMRAASLGGPNARVSARRQQAALAVARVESLDDVAPTSPLLPQDEIVHRQLALERLVAEMAPAEACVLWSQLEGDTIAESSLAAGLPKSVVRRLVREMQQEGPVADARGAGEHAGQVRTAGPWVRTLRKPR